MTRAPASANDIESLVARRAQMRSDNKPPLRGAERQEPRTASGGGHDTDMLDVVQKFEQVYAQFTAEKRERAHEPELAELATAALNTRRVPPASDTRDSRSDTAGPSARLGIATVAPVADLPIERFELPEEETVLQIAARPPARAFQQAHQRVRPRLWPVALGGGALALAVGIGVGYLAIPRTDSNPSRAQIEPSQQGGTQLRVDYDLKPR